MEEQITDNRYVDEPILVSSLEEPLDRINSNFLRIEKYINYTFCEILKRVDQAVFQVKIFGKFELTEEEPRICASFTQQSVKLVPL